MTRVVAVGVFDLLHAGHLHYLEQAKALGDELVVIVAHDDTVRQRKHEPVTSAELRRRMVEGLKPVDTAVIGSPPSASMYEILDLIEPDVICLGYDQEHAEARIRRDLAGLGLDHIRVQRAEGLTDDLDGTRKIIARILELFTVRKALDEVESQPTDADDATRDTLPAAISGTGASEVNVDG